MKGILYKSELYNGWLVKWSNPSEYREPIHEIPLHCDDLENVELEHNNLLVDFEIINNQKLSGVSKCAKLITDLKSINLKKMDNLNWNEIWDKWISGTTNHTVSDLMQFLMDNYVIIKKTENDK